MAGMASSRSITVYTYGRLNVKTWPNSCEMEIGHKYTLDAIDTTQYLIKDEYSNNNNNKQNTQKTGHITVALFFVWIFLLLLLVAGSLGLPEVLLDIWI